MEEHIDSDFIACQQGWNDDDSASLYKSAPDNMWAMVGATGLGCLPHAILIRFRSEKNVYTAVLLPCRRITVLGKIVISRSGARSASR